MPTLKGANSYQLNIEQIKNHWLSFLSGGTSWSAENVGFESTDAGPASTCPTPTGNQLTTGYTAKNYLLYNQGPEEFSFETYIHLHFPWFYNTFDKQN